MNRQKISLFFSSNTNRGAKEEILAITGVYSYNNQAKYLGLPSTVGKSKYQIFGNLNDRIWSKINNWKHDFLFQVGKEILLKVVVQAILIYIMSMFLLFKKLCKDIQQYCLISGGTQTKQWELFHGGSRKSWEK